MSDSQLRISEVFLSLQGEAREVGLPTVFVRLTGCPLRCSYCDTRYAFSGGATLTLPALLERIDSYQVDRVCVTGGEPLAQAHALELLTALCDRHYRVTLETSGALDIEAVDPRVGIVMDLKTPSSGEQAKNRYENLPLLQVKDQLKFVLSDENDYRWARAILLEDELIGRCEILFSPAFGTLDPRQLAEWILEDRLPVRLQVQLHKLLWGDQPGH